MTLDMDIVQVPGVKGRPLCTESLLTFGSPGKRTFKEAAQRVRLVSSLSQPFLRARPRPLALRPGGPEPLELSCVPLNPKPAESELGPRGARVIPDDEPDGVLVPAIAGG